jgi:hypothetical protein
VITLAGTTSEEASFIEVEVFDSFYWPCRAIGRSQIPGSHLALDGARSALANHSRVGVVWWQGGGYGYRLYEHSARKIYRRPT